MLKAVEVMRRGPVGWVIIRHNEQMMEKGWETEDVEEVHAGMAMALDDLRADRAIRIIGITGEHDGDWFNLPSRQRYDEEPRHRARHDWVNIANSPDKARPPERRVPPAIETLALLEKPVIARVNGNALSFGQSVLWGCDIIVAIETAIVADAHMGQGEVIDSRGVARGYPYGMTPGDGAMGFLPLFLPPTKLKEYQFLSRAWTAKELAEMNIVNYAVATYEELDAKVDELIDALLARPQHALERTKRLTNKAVIAQWNLTQDLSHSQELLDLWEHSRAGHMAMSWDPYDPSVLVARPEGGWSPNTPPDAEAVGAA